MERKVRASLGDAPFILQEALDVAKGAGTNMFSNEAPFTAERERAFNQSYGELKRYLQDSNYKAADYMYEAGRRSGLMLGELILSGKREDYKIQGELYLDRILDENPRYTELYGLGYQNAVQENPYSYLFDAGQARGVLDRTVESYPGVRYQKDYAQVHQCLDDVLEDMDYVKTGMTYTMQQMPYVSGRAEVLLGETSKTDLPNDMPFSKTVVEKELSDLKMFLSETKLDSIDELQKLGLQMGSISGEIAMAGSEDTSLYTRLDTILKSSPVYDAVCNRDDEDYGQLFRTALATYEADAALRRGLASYPSLSFSAEYCDLESQVLDAYGDLQQPWLMRDMNAKLYAIAKDREASEPSNVKDVQEPQESKLSAGERMAEDKPVGRTIRTKASMIHPVRGTDSSKAVTVGVIDSHGRSSVGTVFVGAGSVVPDKKTEHLPENQKKAFVVFSPNKPYNFIVRNKNADGAYENDVRTLIGAELIAGNAKYLSERKASYLKSAAVQTEAQVQSDMQMG